MYFPSSSLKARRSSLPKKTSLTGSISCVEFKSSTGILSGNLNIFVQEDCVVHEGIKVRLEGSLDIKIETPSQGHLARRKSLDILGIYGNEVNLNYGDLTLGTHSIPFAIKIPPEHSLPSDFLSSNGELRYYLVGLVRKNGSLQSFVKTGIPFLGYRVLRDDRKDSNITNRQHQIPGSSLFLNFSITSSRQLPNQEVTAQFDLIGLLGQCQIGSCSGSIALVKVETFGTSCRKEKVVTSTSQDFGNYGMTRYELKLTIPPELGPTYEYKLAGVYSIKYLIKYEMKLYLYFNTPLKMGDAKLVRGEVGIMLGTVNSEQEVATTKSCWHRRATIPEPSRMVHNLSSSLMSLPPPYSNLSSRHGSLMSLETLPPHFDDVTNN